MSDLWAFQGTTTAVAGGAITLDTERINAPVAAIRLDKGMVAKIWEIQLEGNGIEEIVIQYSKDNQVTWEDLKHFRKGVATDQERHEKFKRPLIVESWGDLITAVPLLNTTTWIRVINVIGLINQEVTINIEFDEIERQP